MPESINATSAFNPAAPVAATSSDDVITPQQRDQIYDDISAAEWDRYCGFSQVAIGRLRPQEPFSILAGFGDDDGVGEALADFYFSLPDTAMFFLAWHRDSPGMIARRQERGLQT